MKKFREMKKNNKGFSLVELIVVIAIMVVLVAVLGSTILGYVDKSKYSKDIQALDSLKTAISTYVADPKCNYTSGTTYTLLELMQADKDPNGVIKSTLAEVFTLTESGSTISKGEFNASSATFKGLEAKDVLVKIVNGAVNILAPIKDGSSNEPYYVGTEGKSLTAGGGSVNP